ncbi:unnamed protein product, partial [Mesorhabditis belari]|uniref:INTS8 TPR repeats domain-containing protein n=1 Tax=Mesorhabditis belari TaxID=2138241 RepID=A0AAF3EFK0_9BILA
MSLMGKPPAPPPFSELCQAWDMPSRSWIDYFLRPNELSSLLRETRENQDTIAALTLQYVEQTIALEKDLASLRKRTLALTEPSERMEMETDVQYLQYKKSLTWLCTMACFAAIDWAFEKILDEKRQNAHLVRYLIEKTNECIIASKKEHLVNFSQLLYARFCLHINKKMRIPPPAGKPQTNNPNAQEDRGIIVAMSHRKAIAEIREFCKDAATELEKMVLEAKTRRVEVPTIDTFLGPFLQYRDNYLSVALIGKDLTLDGVPMPDFEIVHQQIPENELLNVLRYELACYYFQLLKFDDARKYFGDLTSHLPKELEKISICFINREELNGYLIAVGLPQLAYVAQKADLKVEEMTFTEDNSLSRRFWITREHTETQTREQSRIQILKVENLARDTIDGLPVYPSTAFRDFQPPQITRYLQAITRLWPRLRNVSLHRSLLYYISMSVPRFTESAEKNRFTLTELRNMVTMSSQLPNRSPPSASIISGLLASESLYWNLVTSFDVNSLKNILHQLLQLDSRINLPILYKYPEMLADKVLSHQNPQKFHALLLGKLEQLARLQNIPKWREFLNGVVQQIPILAHQDCVFKEAIIVQTRALNRQLQYAHCAIEQTAIREQVILVKKIIKHNEKRSSEFMVECVAFLLNVDEGDSVLNDIPQTAAADAPYLMLAKLLAAWIQVLTKPHATKVDFTNSFAHFIDMNGIFLSASGKENEAMRRRLEKERGDLLAFIKLLTEQEQLSLLISHLCHLYNRHLFTTNRPTLALEFQYKELWNNNLEMLNAHEDFIDSSLLAALTTGLRLNPMNAFWLRSLADYRYTKGETDEALVLYMETLCACTDNQMMQPFPEVLLNDLMWYRMRVCLTSIGMHTLAALIAQLITLADYRLEQYQVAAENISTQHVLDAFDSLTYLCFDHQLTEALTDAFEKMEMQNRTDAFIQSASHPALNVSNSLEVFTSEKSRRTSSLLRCLAALSFSIHH